MSTTSASYNTCERIIRMAAEDAMLLEDGTLPNGEQYAKWFQKLQDLVTLYQTQGLKLFLLQDIAVTLTAGTNTYSLGPTGTTVMNRPWKVEEAYYLDTNNQLTPVEAIAWKDWILLPNKTATGPITQIVVDKQVSNLVVYTWLTPDATAATGKLHLLLRTQITSYASLTDATLFPPEWFIALRWGLADEICGGQSDSIMQRCAQRAAQFRDMLEAQDVEDASVYFAAEWVR